MNKIVLFLTFILFIGCSSSNPKLIKKEPQKENTPSWIYNPNKGVTLGAVGKDKDEKIALIKARANLSKAIRTHIETITFKKQNNTSSSFSKHSIQNGDATLKSAYIKEKFINKQGYVYIWLVID